jgi:formylglycine-generating enzyme required for sulfatase activity
MIKDFVVRSGSLIYSPVICFSYGRNNYVSKLRFQDDGFRLVLLS